MEEGKRREENEGIVYEWRREEEGARKTKGRGWRENILKGDVKDAK